ncbi:hypothetical protein QDZ26_001855 [Pluralibacter gergoviae]|nr:hypothetical protein [Pluralibacter gergoviae]
MKINELPQWEDEIYQLQRKDRVLGGAEGVANRQAGQLANRTQYLKEQLDLQNINIDGAIDDLRGDLKGPAGWGKTVFAGYQSMESRFQEQATIFDFIKSETDIKTLKYAAGVDVDVSRALEDAITAGKTTLYFPPVPGVYNIGDVDGAQAGFIIHGHARKPYTISTDASFNGCGTVIRLLPGASRLMTFNTRMTFINVLLDGRSLSVNLMQGASQLNGCRFISCGVYRWSTAFGKSNYVGTLYVKDTNVSENGTGFYNLIDSRVIDSTINKNYGRGVSLLAGANNNVFLGVRNEWNEKENYYSYGGRLNEVSGELCDRAGLAAFVAAGGGNWIVSNHVVRRSGKNAAADSDDNCHFRVEGAGSFIMLSNVTTQAGRGDSGEGNLSPERTFITTGNSGDMKIIASGSDLSGCTSVKGIIREKTVAVKNISGCIGTSDVCNTGMAQCEDARLYIGPPLKKGLLPAKGSLVYTHTQKPMEIWQQPIFRMLKIEVRRPSDGSTEYYRVPISFKYESSYVAMTVITSEQKSMPANGWGYGDGASVVVGITVSADGSTISVTLTGKDAFAREVYSYLENW